MKIGLFVNTQKSNAIDTAKKIADLICDKHEVYVHDDLMINSKNIVKLSHSNLGEICDFVIAIGGDGTIINAIKFINENKPILGVNLGRLGYMAGLESDEIHHIPNILDGEHYQEERMMIDVCVNDKYIGNALNDGVIAGEVNRLLDFDVSFDDSDFHYRADGLIIATPTGSTAYSLSAGGPAVDPTQKCFVFTPICPHSLFNRSLVFNDNSIIRAKVKPRDNGAAYVTLDGEYTVKLNSGDTVMFKKSTKTVKLIAKEKRNFYSLINKKLLIIQ